PLSVRVTNPPMPCPGPACGGTLITRSRARPRSPPSAADRDGRVVAKREGHRATDLPGTLADFAVAGTPEPVVLYRSLMTNPASTGSAYSALCTKCLVVALAGCSLSVTANVRTRVVLRLYLRRH